jgi:hypothetical protein
MLYGGAHGDGCAMRGSDEGVAGGGDAKGGLGLGLGLGIPEVAVIAQLPLGSRPMSSLLVSSQRYMEGE